MFERLKEYISSIRKKYAEVYKVPHYYALQGMFRYPIDNFDKKDEEVLSILKEDFPEEVEDNL